VIGAWVATVFAYWQRTLLCRGSSVRAHAWIDPLVPLILIALSRLEEIAAIAFGQSRAV
jgi:hypothetical protein